MTGRSSPRFGVWAAVAGAHGSHFHPDDPPDASWERIKKQILLSEELGYDSTLVAQHTINTRDDANGQFEAWSGVAALAAVTQRIELIAAIKPYLFHPVVLAKMALQIEQISGGRFGINFVNAWYKPELDKAGIGFAAHAERYAYGGEWLEIVKSLISGQRTTFKGRYFTVDDYRITPDDVFRARPLIYAGGESEPARELAVTQADAWFINGRPLDGVRELIADLRRRPRSGPPLRFALSAFVIARASASEAEEALAYAWELNKQDATGIQHLRANADPEAVMFKTAREHPHIGTNGGTAAGLVGDYDSVAQRIVAFHDAGIETFMLQFQPLLAETERFAVEIIPRVRRIIGASQRLY